MKIWIEIAAKEPLKAGDIITYKNKIVSSHNRSVLEPYKEIVLRPININTVKKLVGDKFYQFTDDAGEVMSFFKKRNREKPTFALKDFMEGLDYVAHELVISILESNIRNAKKVRLISRIAETTLSSAYKVVKSYNKFVKV